MQVSSALYPLSVAPMMDWTDRHYRVFVRGLTRRTLLYTEMVTANAVLFGDRARVLGFSEVERPLALQLGGDDPARLAECARIAEAWGYDEINLNVGCPSARVQSGNFGACLMAQPEVVAACVAAMKRAVKIPVTVKHRIGVDDYDSYAHLQRFVATVAAAGAERVSVHARKAWLSGLSPKENRTIPPLRYDVVYALKRDFPKLTVELNGGVLTLGAAQAHLQHVDAVMIGRAAYETPYLLAAADRDLYGEGMGDGTSEGTAGPSRGDAVNVLWPYLEAQLGAGVPLQSMTRHMLGLFNGQPGARAWRRHLSENAHRPGAGTEVVREALRLVPAEVVSARPVRVGETQAV